MSRSRFLFLRNRDGDMEVAVTLVDDAGFGAFDAGRLANSWRQQPGAPASALT